MESIGENDYYSCELVCAYTWVGEKTPIGEIRQSHPLTSESFVNVRGENPFGSVYIAAGRVDVVLRIYVKIVVWSGRPPTFLGIHDPILTAAIAQRRILKGRARFRQAKRAQCVHSDGNFSPFILSPLPIHRHCSIPTHFTSFPYFPYLRSKQRQFSFLPPKITPTDFWRFQRCL